MFLHKLLNGRTVPIVRTGVAPATSDQGLSNPSQIGTFSTKESLFSFAGATAVVALLWHLFPVVYGLGTLPFICGIAGILIWSYNITDPSVHPKPTTRDKFYGFIVAAVNTVQLYLACVGTSAFKPAGLTP